MTFDIDPNDFNLATHQGRYVSATLLASYLDVDRRTIVRMIQHGSLEGIRVGRAYRIPTEAARRVFNVSCETSRAS